MFGQFDIRKGSKADQLGFHQVHTGRGYILRKYETVASRRESVHKTGFHLGFIPLKEIGLACFEAPT